MRVRITRDLLARIERHRPEQGQKLLRDSQLIGFGVLISAQACSFFVERRVGKCGRNRRVTVGRVGLMSLEEARVKALEIILEMAKGCDPAAKKADVAAIPTFRQAIELYLSSRDMRINSRKQYVRDLRRNLADFLDRPITELTRARALEVFEAIEERSPTVALKVGKMADRVCAYAAAHPKYRTENDEPLIPESPWKVLSDMKRKAPIPSRKDHLADSDMPRFYQAVSACENKSARNLALFLLLTGCRLSEARGLKWSEVNILSKRIFLPAERVKTNTAREIPITTQLEVILQDQAVTKLPTCNHVFYSLTQVGPIPEKIFRDEFEQIRTRAGRQDLTPHGLRRSFITHCSRLEIMMEHELRLIVGHAKTMTDRYRQVGVNELKAPMQRATSHLFSLMAARDIDNAEEAV